MILIAAIAVGAIAAFMIFNYVGSVEDQANEGAERVTVFRVDQEIPQGMTGEQASGEGYIVEDEIPRQYLPATAVPDLDQISGRVALSTLAPNQVLVEGMFVDPAEAQVGFQQRLPQNRVAISISTDAVRGVAGMLVPGDKVDIFVAAPCEDNCETDAVPTNAQSRIAFHAVEVLAVGQSTAPQPGEEVTTAAAEEGGEEGAEPAAEEPAITGDTGLITFSVPPDAAQLIAGLSPDQIYLALVGPDYEPEALPVLDINPEMTLPGEDGGHLTPYGPGGDE